MIRARRSPSFSNLAFLSLCALIALLYFGRTVLVPFALSVLLAFILAPVVVFLERWRVPRVPAVVLVFVVVLAAIAGLGWMVSYQLMDVANQLPRYKANIRAKIESIRGPKGRGALTQATSSVKEISKELVGDPASAPEPPATPARTPAKRAAQVLRGNPEGKPVPVEMVDRQTSGFRYFRDLVGPVLGPVGTSFIVIVFTLFILLKREDLRNRLVRLMGPGRLNVTTQALDDAAQRLSRYLLLQALVNITYGSLFATGLYFLGVPNAPLWGVLAGLLRFVPYIGTFGGALLPILLSLAVFEGWTRPLMTAGLFLALELVTGNVIEPLLYGAHTGLSSLAVLVSAVVWTALWGPVGLILATPLTVCMVVIGTYVPRLEFLSIVLGDEPVLPPDALYYQRLLALDQDEAQEVVERVLKQSSVIQMYDSVIIPALHLSEQDRHRGSLDEVRERFIAQSTNELIGDMGEYWARQDEEAGPGQNAVEARASGQRIVCVPARDEADEITAAILAQVLQHSGFNTLAFPLSDSAVDALRSVMGDDADIICVCAMPPFAVEHVRRLCKQIRTQYPRLPVVVVLWNGSAGVEKVSERLGPGVADRVAVNLAGAIEQVQSIAGRNEVNTAAPVPVQV